MSLCQFLDVVVRPNLAELASHPGDLRLAHNAIHAVDALAAHIFVATATRQRAGAKNDTEFRERLATQCADFRLVRDLAKAAKHVELTRGSPETRTVSRAESLRPQSPGWDEARWDEGRWDTPLQVMVVTDAGHVRAVDAVLASAFRFLEVEISARGL